MRLFEIFDTLVPVNYKIRKFSNDLRRVATYEFFVGKKLVEVDFLVNRPLNASQTMVSYIKRFIPLNVKRSNIEYKDLYKKIGGSYELLFSVDGRFDITGKGDSTEIFNGVLSVLFHFMLSNKVAELSFSAHEDSRIKMYKKLADKISKKYNFSLSVDSGQFFAKNNLIFK